MKKKNLKFRSPQSMMAFGQEIKCKKTHIHNILFNLSLYNYPQNIWQNLTLATHNSNKPIIKLGDRYYKMKVYEEIKIIRSIWGILALPAQRFIAYLFNAAFNLTFCSPVTDTVIRLCYAALHSKTCLPAASCSQMARVKIADKLAHTRQSCSTVIETMLSLYESHKDVCDIVLFQSPTSFA